VRNGAKLCSSRRSFEAEMGQNLRSETAIFMAPVLLN
jgi:hypothetical protein